MTSGTRFDELRLPEEATLRLVDGTYQDTRRFAYRWSREAFEAGIKPGAECFTVPGSYAPHAAWTGGEKQRWDDGLILVDMPVPELTVHVLRDREFPFTADVRINSYGDLGPYFAFPWGRRGWKKPSSPTPWTTKPGMRNPGPGMTSPATSGKAEDLNTR